jgi:hypothetical protein
MPSWRKVAGRPSAFERPAKGRSLAEEFDLAGGRQAHAGQDLEQFALAVAGHAGDRHDFAGAQR